LKERASVHKESLKKHETFIQENYGKMEKPLITQLTTITNIVIDHIISNDKFKSYLKDISLELQKYAGNN